MKKIGFIGAYDKSNFIIYTAKILNDLDYKVLVIDTTSTEKIKYIIPSINPTKSYITNFENIDFAVGFKNWEDIEKYLGIRFFSNETTSNAERQAEGRQKTHKNDVYDYILIDIDSSVELESFEMDTADKNYFVTAFDTFSLKKGISIFQNLEVPIDLTRVYFSYDMTKEDEEYLNYISLGCKVNWNEYTISFKVTGEDNKVFEENQRFEKIKFRKLSAYYKDTLAYFIQDLNKSESIGKIKKVMKD